MLKASDVMGVGVKTIRADEPLYQAGRRLITEGISAAAVVDEGDRPVGVLSVTDLLAYVAGLEHDQPARHLADLSEPHQRDVGWFRNLPGGVPVSQVMTPFLVRVQLDTPLAEVAALMSQAGIHRVFVCGGERLAGVISSLDLVSVLEKQLLTAVA